MKVKMFRVLVVAEIRENPTGPLFTHDLVRDSPDHGQHLVQKDLVGVSEVDEGRNVPLRNHDDVDRPERARVAEGEDFVRLHNHLHGCPAAESFVAVEILAHGALLPYRRSQGCARQDSCRIERGKRRVLVADEQWEFGTAEYHRIAPAVVSLPDDML